MTAALYNITYPIDFPPLPIYSASVQAPLLPLIKDKHLIAVALVIAYWAFSLFFLYADEWGFFRRYRLHTPAELLKRNRVSMRDVIRDVLLEQAAQAVFSGVIAWFEPDTYITGKECDIRVWAQKIRMAQRAIPYVLLVISIDGLTMAKNVQSGFPTVAGPLAGGRYPALVQRYLTPSHLELSLLRLCHGG